MIRLQNLTPEIYYDQSRDFQLIGRMFDLVLNSAKTEADLVATLPFSDNSPDDLLELLALTFGLRLERGKYTNNQLRALCSVALKMMRTKGSLKAIELLCTSLMRADGVAGEFLIDLSEIGVIKIYLPPEADQKELITEILPYIMPAGYIYKVYYAVFKRVDTPVIFKLDTRVKYAKQQENNHSLPIIKFNAEQVISKNSAATVVPVEIIQSGKLFDIMPAEGDTRMYMGFTMNTTLYVPPKEVEND